MCHFTETHTAETELTEVTAWATVYLVAVAQTNWRSVTRKLLETQASFFALFVSGVRVNELTLEFSATFCVALDDFEALLITSDL